MQPTLLVLAAGMGSRYGGLKQVDRFGPTGETIVEYSIFDALRAGFGKIILVVRNEFINDFKELVLKRAFKKADIRFVFQELDNLPPGFKVPPGRIKPWGTAHAVLIAESQINTPFAVINADDFYGAESYQIMYDFLMKKQSGKTEEYCLVGYQLANTLSESGSVARGICQVNKKGYLTDIIEHKNIFKTGNEFFSELPDKTRLKLHGNEHVSMNMMGFLPPFLIHLRTLFADFLRQNINDPGAEFYLPFALNHVIHAGKASVRMLATNSQWFGVTYAADKSIVTDNLKTLVSKGIYPKDLWE